MSHGEFPCHEVHKQFHYVSCMPEGTEVKLSLHLRKQASSAKVVIPVEKEG